MDVMILFTIMPFLWLVLILHHFQKLIDIAQLKLQTGSRTFAPRSFAPRPFAPRPFAPHAFCPPAFCPPVFCPPCLLPPMPFAPPPMEHLNLNRNYILKMNISDKVRVVDICLLCMIVGINIQIWKDISFTRQ